MGRSLEFRKREKHFYRKTDFAGTYKFLKKVFFCIVEIRAKVGIYILG
jgi:hypothetical protein